MSEPQKKYRVYCYDAAHTAVSAELIEAATDDEAITKAKAAGFGCKCEVWQGNRLVARLEAERRTG
jgi:hypothetical protein